MRHLNGVSLAGRYGGPFWLLGRQVNIFNYFVFVEGGEQRGYTSLSYCKIVLTIK